MCGIHSLLVMLDLAAFSDNELQHQLRTGLPKIFTKNRSQNVLADCQCRNRVIWGTEAAFRAGRSSDFTHDREYIRGLKNQVKESEGLAYPFTVITKFMFLDPHTDPSLLLNVRNRTCLIFLIGNTPELSRSKERKRVLLDSPPPHPGLQARDLRDL